MKSQQAAGTQLLDAPAEDRERVFDAFRRWGYLQANLDPLGQIKPQPQAELDLGSLRHLVVETAQEFLGAY